MAGRGDEQVGPYDGGGRRDLEGDGREIDLDTRGDEQVMVGDVAVEPNDDEGQAKQPTGHA